MSSGSSYIASVPKLKGRENYDDWAFAVENFLILDGLQKCLDGTEEDTNKCAQARAKLILTIDASLYVHIKQTTKPKELLEKLQSMFSDSGFTRKISLLRLLISTRLEDCDNMASYVNQVVETSQRLRNTGFNIDDEWIGSLLLAGLPEKYAPMIMAIEHSGIAITADAIKTKLLDMEVEVDKVGSAFAGNKFVRKKRKKFGNNVKVGNTGNVDLSHQLSRKKSHVTDVNKRATTKVIVLKKEALMYLVRYS